MASRRSSFVVSYFLTVAVLWFLVCLALPNVFVRRIERDFASACDVCDLKIGWVSLAPWNPLRLRLQDVRLHVGVRGFQEVEAHIENLSVNLDLGSIPRRELVLHRLEINGAEVSLIDSDSKQGSTSLAGDFPDFAIEGLGLHRIEFSYTRNLKGTHAVFQAHGIEATFDPFGTRAGDDHVAKGTARGQIEKSGEVALDLSVRLVPLSPPTIDLKVHAKNQNLADLTTFFKPNAGVILKGELLHGEASAGVRGSKLHATVEATYKDFEVTVEPMWDRDETATFFTNLATSVGTRSGNVDQREALKTKEIEIEREPDEPIVAFILRGLKTAAIGVATK